VARALSDPGATRRLVLLVLGALLSGACAAVGGGGADATTAGEPNVEAIDRIVEGYIDEHDVAGAAVALIRGDRVLLAEGYGLASLELDVPVTPKTMFQSGSLGKMFTAAAVMVLVEDGRVDLDASVREYLADAPERWQAITVRHLLTHTAGLPDYLSEDFDLLRDLTEDEMVRMAAALELEFAPGSRWSYSNTGYVLLGVLVHRVGGKPYGELLRERVWDPGGVPTMRVNFAADVVPHRSQGYHFEGGIFRNQGWVAPSLNSTADGALLMSLEDMIAWNEVVRARSVLSAASWQQVLTPVTLASGNTYPYGFGWAIDEIDGRLVHQHGGGWQGFRTHYARFVGDDVAIVVLANTAHASPGEILWDVAAAYDPSYARKPPDTEPIDDPDPEAAALVSAMLDKASRGGLELSDFAFVRQTSFPWIRDSLAESLAGLGAPDRLELLERERLGDDWYLVYRAWYGERQLRVSAGVAPGGGLVHLSAREAQAEGEG
jgi:CubicO group peptidase (beta-lactamase class C family)